MQTHKNTDPHLSPQHKTLTHIYLLQPRTIHTHISFTCYCTVLYTYELYCTVLCCITVCTYCTVLQEHPCVITVCTYVLYCTVLHTYVRTYALYKQLSTYVYCREVRTRLPELAEYRSWPSTYPNAYPTEAGAFGSHHGLRRRSSEEGRTFPLQLRSCVLLVVTDKFCVLRDPLGGDHRRHNHILH